MDLTEFLKSGDYGQLKWKEKKLKNNSSFLARWGQSTATFAGKIYIFAGRFSNDLNDLLVFDPGNDTLKAIKTDLSDVPKPRRRHCAGFFGSSMLIFGGFNGEYFNDLHYINVH